MSSWSRNAGTARIAFAANSWTGRHALSARRWTSPSGHCSQSFGKPSSRTAGGGPPARTPRFKRNVLRLGEGS